ncbi:hypothetical protein Tco_0868326 [Tanacetum coccineum]
MSFIIFQDVCLRQELLEYMVVQSRILPEESSKLSWGNSVVVTLILLCYQHYSGGRKVHFRILIDSGATVSTSGKGIKCVLQVLDDSSTKFRCALASPSNGVEWGCSGGGGLADSSYTFSTSSSSSSSSLFKHVFLLCSTIASVVCAFADDDEENDPYLGEASRSPCFVQCDKGESDSYLGGASRIRVCCHGGSATLKFELNDTNYKMEDTYAVVRSCQVTHLLLNVWHVFWLCSTIASVVCAFADDDKESDPYLGEASRSPVYSHDGYRLVPSCLAIFTFKPLTLSLTSMPSCDLESLSLNLELS